MGPKLRQARNELVSCGLCGCLMANKDSVLHTKICTNTSPLNVVLNPNVDPADNIDYHNYGHGLIMDHILIGNVEEVKKKDIPDHFPQNLQNRMVLMHPAAMRHLQIYISKPVVIEWQEVFYAWPCSAVPLTTIRMIKATMEKYQYQNKQVAVQSLRSPDITAAVIHCHIRNVADITKQQLTDHLIRLSVGRYVTCGSTLNLNYYGQPCDVQVSAVTGEDGSIQNIQNDLDITASLSEQVDRLNLEADLPQYSSTPCKADRSTEKRADIYQLPQFYKISHHTRIVINPDDDKAGSDVRTAWPSLRDFGGFSQQIELIKEVTSIHLFKQQKLTEQGLRSPGGLLLYGPSGGGKTMLVNALAKEFSVHFISVSGAEIWSRYYGESEAKLASVMKEAENCAPSIVFLDEVDVLCPKRENSKNDVERRIVATLLASLDRMSNNSKPVFVLAATSKRENVDGALRRPGRLDLEVEIGVPSVNDRQEIIEKLLWQTEHNISFAVIRDIAEKTHGFLGADLAAVYKEAMLHALKRESLNVKITLQSDDLYYGFQKVKPSAMKEVTLEVSKVSWSDIGGQEELKLKLRQAVEWPLKHPEAFTRLGIRPPRGLLMYGPPGCSKTMIAKALAKESGLNFIAIKGPELFSKWVGESERAVRDVFNKARAAAPAIVFFDEIDALAGERGSQGSGGGDVSDRVLAQLLTEMDGVQALEDILVVAATNRPDRIDKALMRPGRLDRIIYVPLPDAATRKAIFSLHFKRTPVASDVDIDELVERTEQYSGAEVSAVCHEAALAALQEDINSTTVHRKHFNEALLAVKPRITPELVALYDKYRDHDSVLP